MTNRFHLCVDILFEAYYSSSNKFICINFIYVHFHQFIINTLLLLTTISFEDKRPSLPLHPEKLLVPFPNSRHQGTQIFDARVFVQPVRILPPLRPEDKKVQFFAEKYG